MILTVWYIFFLLDFSIHHPEYFKTLYLKNNLFANDSAILAGLSWVILLNALPGVTHAAVVTKRLD